MLQPLIHFASCHAQGCHNPIIPFTLSLFYFTEMNMLLNNSVLVCCSLLEIFPKLQQCTEQSFSSCKLLTYFSEASQNEKFLFAYVILFNLKAATDLMLKIIRNKGLRIYGVNSSLTMLPQPNIPNSILVITVSYCVV